MKRPPTISQLALLSERAAILSDDLSELNAALDTYLCSKEGAHALQRSLLLLARDATQCAAMLRRSAEQT